MRDPGSIVILKGSENESLRGEHRGNRDGSITSDKVGSDGTSKLRTDR